MRALSFQLHVLTSRLDRAADRILRAELSLSYSRFLALFAIDTLGASTQRDLAATLGITEASVSRMTSLLVEEKRIVATRHGTGGNRNQLALTRAGKQLVRRCRELLEKRLVEMVAATGVPYERYLNHTLRLVAALEALDEEAPVKRKRKEKR
jgi:DNA-binding MarR family transcriptional regulator